jgi:hypothetical protein
MDEDKITMLNPPTWPTSWSKEVVIPTLLAGTASGVAMLISIWAGKKITGWLAIEWWNRYNEATTE